MITNYFIAAMKYAEIKKLEDGSYSGRIPQCKGVIAFGETKTECRGKLRETLEDWVMLALKHQHRLPVIDGINLNSDRKHEQMVSV